MSRPLERKRALAYDYRLCYETLRSTLNKAQKQKAEYIDALFKQMGLSEFSKAMSFAKLKQDGKLT